MQRVIFIVATLPVLGRLINANDATTSIASPRLVSIAGFSVPLIAATMVPYVVASGLTSETTSSAALTEALMEFEKTNHSVTPVMASETTTLETTATKKGRKRKKRPTKNPMVTNQFRLDLHFDEKDGFGTLPFPPTTMTMTTTTTVTVKPVKSKSYPKGRVYGHFLDALGLLATILSY
uniref:RxLR effector protein n=1 Tax=Panagrellus redivivus TaxID=6233 RepID=A0A7E4VNH2_PANRE